MENLTSSRNSTELDYEYENGMLICKSIVCLVSLMANIALLATQVSKIQLHDYQKHTMTYAYINLAIINLIKTVYITMVSIIWARMPWWNTENDIVHRITSFAKVFEGLATTFSVVCVLMIYVAVRATKREGLLTAAFFILPVWVASGAISVPVVILPKAVAENYDQYYSILLDIVGFILPMSISVVLCCASFAVGNKEQATINGYSDMAQVWDNTSQVCINTQEPLIRNINTEFRTKQSYVPLIVNLIYFMLALPCMVVITIDRYVVKLHYFISFDHYYWRDIVDVAAVALIGIIAVIGSVVKIQDSRKGGSNFNFQKF